ncbi:MAG: M56 family metallopeptidase [Planctomycetaceae bacterium]
MTFSQSFVVAWLQFVIASAVLLTLAAVALKKLPQPVDRIRLIQIALAAMTVLPPLIAFAPVSLLRLNLFPPTAAPPASNSPAQPSPTIPRVTPESESSPTAFAEHHSAPADALRENRSTSAATADMVKPSSSTDLWFMFAALIVISHAAAVMFFCIEWTIGRRRLHWLCRDATSPSEMVMREWTAVSQGQGERVRLLVSSEIDVPLMFGCRRPVVLIPRELAEAGGSALRFCLSHEWSHIARRDARTWAAAWCCQFLLWMQPAYWSLRKELRLCQDMLADDQATASNDDAVAYSELLVSFARRRLAVRPTGALTLIDRPSQLTRRITMLLKRPISVRSNSSWKLSLSLAAIAFAFAFVAGGIRFDAARGEDDEAAVPVKPSQAETATQKKENAVPKEETAEPLQYTCAVVDKETGKGIEGARVVVRRSILKSDENTPVAETRHTTDAEGKYIVDIPAEQVAMPYLYIELDAEHDDYAPRKGFGYALSMIRKNEELGERPFFEKTELYPGEAVTGMVISPEGERLEGIKVQGFSMADLSTFSFSDTLTDAEGRFRLMFHKASDAIVWVIPKDYAIVEEFVAMQRGELKTIQLEPGIRIEGRVLDVQGKPVPGVAVNIEHVRDSGAGGLPVGTSVQRGELSDEYGRFKFDPLPAGQYRIQPRERIRNPLVLDRAIYPLPAVFVPKTLVTKNEEPEISVDVQAVPHVTFNAQVFDSDGNKTRGHSAFLTGRYDGEFWHNSARPDETGKMELQLPRGLEEVKLQLVTNEHGALRYRRGKGELLPGSAASIDLGEINDDIDDFEIVKYLAPIAIISAVDENGEPIKPFDVAAKYSRESNQIAVEPDKNRGGADEWAWRATLHLERQTDGRIRTRQMLPDEDVTFTITAEGYEPVIEKVNLPEGETKELVVRLKKVK